MRQFNNSTIQQFCKGFTLIELLTAIAVIGIVSAVVLVNLNTGKKRKDVHRAAQKLMLDIRKAQNDALAPGAEADCIYGLKVATTTPATQYFLYKRSEVQCADDKKKYVAGQSTIIETVVLDEDIFISNATTTNLDFSFESPEPITYINGNTTVSERTIRLKSNVANNIVKRVTVNRLGLVEIQ